MANVQLVIEVDERDVDFVRKNYKPTGYSYIPLHIQTEFVSAILNGVPVPKGHGRIGDLDALANEIPIDVCDGFEVTDIIEAASPIIEADKESEE